MSLQVKRVWSADEGWHYEVEEEAAGGLPSQWTDGGSGDVTAATDQDLTNPLTLDSSALGDFDDVLVLLPGDPDRLNGDGNVVRMESVGAGQLLLNGYGFLALLGPSAGIGVGTSAVSGDQSFRVKAGKVGFFDRAGTGGVVQQNHIADPSGGSTTDAEARAAIDAILDALEAYGLLKTS